MQQDLWTLFAELWGFKLARGSQRGAGLITETVLVWMQAGVESSYMGNCSVAVTKNVELCSESDAKNMLQPASHSIASGERKLYQERDKEHFWFYMSVPTELWSIHTASFLSWGHPCTGTMCCAPPKRAEGDFCALCCGESGIQVLMFFTYSKTLSKIGVVTVWFNTLFLKNIEILGRRKQSSELRFQSLNFHIIKLEGRRYFLVHLYSECFQQL